ncbi:uncharacterized protein LOC124813432 [Hydra vulgaris]|uniref:uncharacterized protein LOC124813432 n=1 Tax=Hydra vulgaris TaxID=6087 RepID=UPI001F5EE226|nr:uncharacterized protein LOC124813432 [Hydra vulgaris]
MSSNAKASQTDELILETISAHPVKTSSLERNPKKSRATLLKHNAHNEPLSNVTLLSSMKKTEQLQCLDIPIKALSPLPVRTSPLKRKKNNSNTTVLTSSPYKDALSGRALLRPNKKIKQDRQCLKECEKANKSLQNESWFCYLCEENIKKSMIQCLTY